MSLFGNWAQQQQGQQQPQQPAGGFGQPAQQPGAFGGAGAGAFGQPAGGAFGQPAQQPAFGASTSTTPAFGGFGQQPRPGFGATAPSGFGATTPGAGGFGGFGGTGAGVSGATAFGAQPAGATTGSNMFGASNTAQAGTPGFGATTSLFGPKPATTGFGVAAGALPAAPGTNGTAAPPYEATQERDTVGTQTVMLHFQSISCMPAYKTQSFEELRVQDYAQGRKTASSYGQIGFGGGMFAAANPTPGFGTPATAGSYGAGAPGGFGQPPTGPSSFANPAGQPQTSLFGGSATTGGFGQPPAGTAGFGGFGQQQPKPAAFVAQQPTAGGFGTFGQPQQPPAATGTFGQPQTANGFGFGNNATQPKPLFGAGATATPAFGQPQQPDPSKTTGLFGGFGQQQPAQPGSGFGAQPATQPQPGMFGQPAPTAAPSLFGQQQQQPQPQPGFGNLFGSAPKPANPTVPSLFGGNAFGQPAQQLVNPMAGQPTQPSLFGGMAPQPANPGFGNGSTSLFGPKSAGTTPSMFGAQPMAQPQPSMFGVSTAATVGTGSIFGASTLGGQQQQQSLVASIEKPIDHVLPVFSLLPPGPRSISINSFNASSTAMPAAKKPSYFADLPTKAPVPRLGSATYNPPSAKLRGFSTSISANALSGSISNLALSRSTSRNLSSSPFSSSTSFIRPTMSTSLSTMAPEAFATSSSSVSLSGKRHSVKKLVLDKRPSSPAPGAGDSRPGSPVPASSSKVSFNPSAGARERERERSAVPAPPPPVAAPRPPSPSPEARRAATPTPAAKFGTSTSGSDPKQSNLQDGYWIRPSIQALSRATKPVDGLTIGRNGYGSVTFLVPVDLKDCPPPADIPGNVVVIDNKECTVYPDEDTKAPEGTGLNVPARIALDGCWAVDKANRQPMSDTKFISFDIEKGTWTFNVEHFSRYGLGGDDESDEDEEMDDVEISPLKGKEKGRSAAAAARAAAPVVEKDVFNAGANSTASANRKMPFAARKGVEADKVHVMQASLFRVPETRAAAAEATKATRSSPFGFASAPKSKRDDAQRGAASGQATRKPSESQLLFPATSATNVGSAAHAASSTPNPPAPRTLSATSRVAYTLPTHINATGTGAENIVFDAGLALGRSFRVSWGPGGRLVGSGRLLKPSESAMREQPTSKSVVSIRQIPNASFDENTIRQDMKRLVGLQFQQSQLEVDDCDVPFASPNKSLRFRNFASLFAGDDKSNDALLWRLLVALFDEIPLRLPQGLGAAVREKAQALCRRQALSDWLESAVASVVDSEAQTGTVALRIFSLLTGNQVGRAATLAADNGNLHLANLIAQHGSDPNVTDDLAHQLSIWTEQRAAAHMDPSLLRIYALLSGETDKLPGSRSSERLESVPAIDVTGTLDWKRAFGLRLWYSNGATTHDAALALEEYESFWAQEKKAAPLRAGERDAAYELIRAALRPDIPLDTVLVPRTFAGSPLDFRMTWHVYIMLSRVLKQRDFADRQAVDIADDDFDVVGHSPTADLVTSAYALQLESVGLYSEAVFVLLHLEAPTGRVRAIKDLLSRNFTRLSEDDQNVFNQLSIPETWLKEAETAYLISQGRFYDAFNAAIKAENQQHLAYKLVVENLVPDAILRDDLELLRTMFSEFDASTVDGWAMKGQLFVDYIELMNAHPSPETTVKAQQLLSSIPAGTTDMLPTAHGMKSDARWAACRARMISNLLELTGRLNMRYSDNGEIALVDDSTRAKHVQALAFDSFISVLG
ncbi:nuclear protein 96-domain-containing protein [Auriculariales sp. MPI-PUGE-AT-0066]|nr:nuclear protein 96-domain-containing protein [Auriculariales sp. MPI-PUGE-AT-0066]